jgi:hypothetical protein
MKEGEIRKRVNGFFRPIKDWNHGQGEFAQELKDWYFNRLMKNFKSHIRVEDNGCWVWTGAVSDMGYGKFVIREKTMPVHIIAYRVYWDNYDDSRVIHHTCGNKLCVHPYHLSQIAYRENLRIGNPKKSRKQTH